MTMEEHILGWTYRIEKEAKPMINMKPDKEMSKPEFLYKYFPLNDNTLNCLKESYLFLSHPDYFNDPFDSFRGLLNIEMKDLETYYQFLFSKIGIVSMSADDRNVLMWGHYCNNQGLTLKFKTNYLSKSMLGPFFMNYQSKLPNLTKYELPIRFIASLNIKSNIWEYEKEWRFIKESYFPMKIPKKYETGDVLVFDRFLNYDKSEIKELTLGFKFIFEEQFSKHNNFIFFETKNEIKTGILDYIIKNDINVKLIDIVQTEDFELEKKEIIICMSSKQVGQNKSMN